MRWGRQEDAHEFLRYVVDALQRSALVGLSKYVIIGRLLLSKESISQSNLSFLKCCLNKILGDVSYEY